MKIVFYGTREYDHYYFDVLAADPVLLCKKIEKTLILK